MNHHAGAGIVSAFPALAAILEGYADALGSDFLPYRNHACRVANLCAAGVAPSTDALDKIAIAAAFHDLGIWTDQTFDYLVPSARLAIAHLEAIDRADWIPEIAAMIFNHHKVTPLREHPEWLVEPFRRADWIDVTGGLFTRGATRRLGKALYATWPGAGFHRRLLALEAAHLRAHPLNPLPFFRL